VNVRILEVDAERRRLSLSLKRVEDGMPIQPAPGEDAAPPSIDLSEDVFSDQPAAEVELVENDVDTSVLVEPEAEVEAPAAEAVADEEPAVASVDEPDAVAETAPGSDEPAPE
jgi:small subunit ribosomal protein S1